MNLLIERDVRLLSKPICLSEDRLREFDRLINNYLATPYNMNIFMKTVEYYYREWKEKYSRRMLPSIISDTINSENKAMIDEYTIMFMYDCDEAQDMELLYLRDIEQKVETNTENLIEEMSDLWDKNEILWVKQEQSILFEELL